MRLRKNLEAIVIDMLEAGQNLRPGCDLGIDIICGYTAKGVDGVWTRVPAPSTLVLLGVGVGTLALYRRRSLRI